MSICWFAVSMNYLKTRSGVYCLGYFVSPAGSACTPCIFFSLMTTSYDLMQTLICVLRKAFRWFLLSNLTKSEFES
jgi:hypothetical protein